MCYNKNMSKYENINEIIKKCIEDISNDICSLQMVGQIDFLDIFPKSVEHKELLDNEAIKIANVIDKTERGNFYVFHKPIKTKYGELKIIKIRKFDETRLPWVAAPDFATTDYNNFLSKYKSDDRFKYIEKPTYKGLEFKTDKSLIYFLDELTTHYYGIK